MNFKNTSVRRDCREAGEEEKDHSSQTRATPPAWRGIVRQPDPGAGSGPEGVYVIAPGRGREAGKHPQLAG